MTNPRYAPLYETVDLARPGVIVEVGTHNAHRGTQIIARALEHRQASEIEYHGFDFWERLPDDIRAEQFPALPKGKAKITTATRRIRQFGIAFHLHPGDSRATVPAYAPKHIDLAFIDGGHEVETIRSDYVHVRHARWLVFDDVYLDPSIAKSFGALRIIREHDLRCWFTGYYDHSAIGPTCMAVAHGDERR